MDHLRLIALLLACACGTGIDGADGSTKRVGTTPGAGDVLGILVTPEDVVVPVGSAIQLEALGLNADRQTLDLTDVVDWSSTNASVASVSNDLNEEGGLQGVTAGSAVVEAALDGVRSAPARIIVTDAVLVRLSVGQTSVTLAVGQALQLKANATFSDGSSADATSQVRWIIGDGEVAQFEGGGMLEGVGSGTTSARVEWEGVSSEPISVEVVDEATTASGDLLFDWVSGSIDDGTFEVSASVHNASSAPVYGVWLDLFVDQDFVPTYGDWPDWYHMIEYIGPDESASVTFSASTTADRHDFALLLDSMESVVESDEENNLVEGATDEFSSGGAGGGTVGSGGEANLLITYVGGFSEDGVTEYWVDVANSGTGVAERFYIDIWHDVPESAEPDLYADGDDYVLYEGGLLPDEVHYATLSVPSACDGCSAWAMVDSYDMVAESDESDNTYFFDSAD